MKNVIKLTGIVLVIMLGFASCGEVDQGGVGSVSITGSGWINEQLTAVADGGIEKEYVYVWELNGTVVGSATTVNYTPTALGYVKVTVSDSNGGKSTEKGIAPALFKNTTWMAESNKAGNTETVTFPDSGTFRLVEGTTGDTLNFTINRWERLEQLPAPLPTNSSYAGTIYKMHGVSTGNYSSTPYTSILIKMDSSDNAFLRAAIGLDIWTDDKDGNVRVYSIQH